jgi:hypothetical protein
VGLFFSTPTWSEKVNIVLYLKKHVKKVRQDHDVENNFQFYIPCKLGFYLLTGSEIIFSYVVKILLLCS